MSEVIDVPENIAFFDAPMVVTLGARMDGKQVFFPGQRIARFMRHKGMEDYLDGVATFVFHAPDQTTDVNAT